MDLKQSSWVLVDANLSPSRVFSDQIRIGTAKADNSTHWCSQHIMLAFFFDPFLDPPWRTPLQLCQLMKNLSTQSRVEWFPSCKRVCCELYILPLSFIIFAPCWWSEYQDRIWHCYRIEILLKCCVLFLQRWYIDLDQRSELTAAGRNYLCHSPMPSNSLPYWTDTWKTLLCAFLDRHRCLYHWRIHLQCWYARPRINKINENEHLSSRS